MNYVNINMNLYSVYYPWNIRNYIYIFQIYYNNIKIYNKYFTSITCYKIMSIHSVFCNIIGYFYLLLLCKTIM